MPEQHVQVLTGLGLSKELVDALETMTPEQLKEFKPEVYVDPIRTGVRTALSNDAEFLKTIPKDKIDPTILKEIESGQYARFQNELVEVATKKLGLEDKELTAEDRKSIKTLSEKMAVLYLGKNSKVEGLQAMQADLAKARQELTELTGKQEETLKKALEEANGKNTSKLIKLLTASELSSLEGVELSVAGKYVTDPVLAEVTKDYAVVLEGDDLVLKQKANNALDVIDSAGKKVTFADALKAAVLKTKLGSEKKADDPNDPGKTRRVVIEGGGPDGGGDNDDVEIPSYIKNRVDSNSKLEEGQK